MAAATTSSFSTGVSEPLDLTPARAAAIADRHTGIGCDQLIVIQPPDPGRRRIHAHYQPGRLRGRRVRQRHPLCRPILLRETGRTAVAIRTISGDLPASPCPTA